MLFVAPVWPEPASSAAGVRTAALCRHFHASGWRVAFLSAADRNGPEAALAATGVTTFSIKANRERELAEALASTRPSVVVFDRFYAEEMFSFRVRELCPQALRVLDMQGEQERV